MVEAPTLWHTSLQVAMLMDSGVRPGLYIKYLGSMRSSVDSNAAAMEKLYEAVAAQRVQPSNESYDLTGQPSMLTETQVADMLQSQAELPLSDLSSDLDPELSAMPGLQQSRPPRLTKTARDEVAGAMLTLQRSIDTSIGEISANDPR